MNNKFTSLVGRSTSQCSKRHSIKCLCRLFKQLYSRECLCRLFIQLYGRQCLAQDSYLFSTIYLLKYTYSLLLKDVNFIQVKLSYFNFYFYFHLVMDYDRLLIAKLGLVWVKDINANLYLNILCLFMPYHENYQK